jgi:lysophospholipase L1-like esterase
MLGVQLACALLTAALAAGCDNPAGPTPPDPDTPPGPETPPQISCPEDRRVESPNGEPVVVEYPAPSVTGGVPPVEVSCVPESGSSFAIGTTAVNCTGRDQQEHVAQCAFTTTVEARAEIVPKLKATKFVAFGDSITYGTTAPCGTSLRGYSPAWRELDVQTFWLSADLSSAYPSVLQRMLADRYREQSIVVHNEGLPGENVTDPATRDRLRTVLSRDTPDVLLLQEGVNDLHSPATIDEVANALNELVREARNRGIPVLLGTLLPERVGACRAYAPERIAPANERIRDIAAIEQVGLVDLYQAFLGQEDVLLGEDGLHPNAAGYEKIAEVFFGAIRGGFETTAVRTSMTRRR